jgi:hypothetical protein
MAICEYGKQHQVTYQYFKNHKTMRKIAELRTDHTDEEDGLRYIDAYFTDDDMEQGKTIAVVDIFSGKPIFFDNLYRNDTLVEEAIKEIQSDIFEANVTRKMEMEVIFKTEITFFDVLHSGSDKFKEYYNGLSEENKRQFIQMNDHSIKLGCEYGLQTGDVMSDIASNLEPDTL